MKIIACHSAKGGVGKTAAAVNLAHVLAGRGLRTLLCDLDPQGAAGFCLRVKPARKLTGTRFFRDADRVEAAIRGSDHDGLDVLPANEDFRDFDVLLSQMKDPRTRLRKVLAGAGAGYDVVVLDCPPGLSMLAENVFRAADAVLVPVIPTTLSQRSFGQLLDFLAERDLPEGLVHAFFSMVQAGKRLHADTMQALRAAHPDRFLEARIPFSADVERMGLRRAPVTASLPDSAAARAFRALGAELASRAGLAPAPHPG